jgi:hypothetical protein
MKYVLIVETWKRYINEDVSPTPSTNQSQLRTYGDLQKMPCDCWHSLKI